MVSKVFPFRALLILLAPCGLANRPLVGAIRDIEQASEHVANKSKIHGRAEVQDCDGAVGQMCSQCPAEMDDICSACRSCAATINARSSRSLDEQCMGCPEALEDKCVAVEACEERIGAKPFLAQMRRAGKSMMEVPDDGNSLFAAVAAAYRSAVKKEAEVIPSTKTIDCFDARCMRATAHAIVAAKLRGKATADTQNFSPLDVSVAVMGPMSEVLDHRVDIARDPTYDEETYLTDMGSEHVKGSDQIQSRHWSAEAQIAALAAALRRPIKVYMGNPPRVDDDALETAKKHFNLRPSLQQKLVMHKGWHRNHESDMSRPLGNTRQAYIDSSKVGAAYAECDVWSTRDGQIVLGHDSSLQRMALDPEEALARTLVSEVDWQELKTLRLMDGSTPVLLATVLEDLVGSGTRLVIELKSSGPAAFLAAFLLEHPKLISAVAWVMSFSLSAVELFEEHMARVELQRERVELLDFSGPPLGVRVLWLLDNPRVPYDTKDKTEGETTFDYATDTLAAFLSRNSLTERIRSLQCGLYIQYNPALTFSHMLKIRADLNSIFQHAFLGFWSDASLDPEMDTVAGLSKWLPFVDALNSDIPASFWANVGTPRTTCFQCQSLEIWLHNDGRHYDAFVYTHPF